ncbi:hypothetical protein CCUG63697_04803 [Mycobacteroides franklinii]|uniref:Uncharacterized protein n=1 Tax=Mycobacteroides franklinii TaxID=948102 RepID=A0A4R8QT32_9MYCO|nr:hypothetical protein CCUG63697_04803 [Mycobacteroides franklinii]
MQFSPPAVAHEELDVAGHVVFQSVVAVEALKFQLVLEVLVDGGTVLLQPPDAEGDDAEHVEDVQDTATITLGQLGAEPGDFTPVLPGVARLDHPRTPQLITEVSVHVVVALGQHAREDAVKQGEHLPIGNPHRLRRRQVTVVLLGLIARDERRREQIADVLADGDTLRVSHVLEFIADLIVDSDIQDGHIVLLNVILYD